MENFGIMKKIHQHKTDEWVDAICTFQTQDDADKYAARLENMSDFILDTKVVRTKNPATHYFDGEVMRFLATRR